MPDGEHRPFGKIRPPVTPHRDDFAGSPDSARISVQQQGREPHRDPVHWRQKPADELQCNVNRAGDTVPSNSVKLRRGNRFGAPPQCRQPSDFRREFVPTVLTGSV